jgi:hypothetical protein
MRETRRSLHSPCKALAGFQGGSGIWHAPWGHMKKQHSHRNMPCFIVASLILVAGGFSLAYLPLEGMPHILVPRSDSLINFRAGSSTCYCSRMLLAGRHLAVFLLLSGYSRYSCLWLFVLVSKPPSPAPLWEVWYKLDFHSWSCLKAKENASVMCKSLVSLTAVRAVTPWTKFAKAHQSRSSLCEVRTLEVGQTSC